MFKNYINPRQYALGAIMALAALALVSPAFASTGADLFGAQSPFEKVLEFITGPFAWFIVILALVVFGAMLVMGSDFTGFGRRIPMLLLGIAFVMGAVQIVTALFGSSQSATLTDAQIQALERPAITGAFDQE